MNNGAAIPFLDLVGQHRELEDEIIEAIRAALRKASFIGGEALDEFEAAFAEFTGSKYAVGVASGTDALKIALLSAGVTTNDTVVTVPNTFIATTEAISQAGALPAFVDVNERTSNMDARALREYVERECLKVDGHLFDKKTGRRVAAVIPVHLYGQVCDMDEIMAVADENGLIVIEDACQAHGALYGSKSFGMKMGAGSMGLAGAFSFYPGKNLGACGEAGAITTSNADLAKKARMIRDHGQREKYFHELEGCNGRLDAIQAAILSIKLKRLPEWNRLRRSVAALYNSLLNGMEGITAPFEPEWSESVYHLYVIRSKDRDALKAHLADAGVSTGLHYPLPLHLQKAYTRLGYKAGSFPVAESAAKEGLSLPMFPRLSEGEVRKVAGAIESFSTQDRVSARGNLTGRTS